MKLLKAIFQFLGFRFAPDNHVVPVLRMGLYHRVAGPGVVWINPLFEQSLPPVKTSIYVSKLYFEEVMSKDNIPFTVQMTALSTFDPNSARKNAAAVLVKGGEPVIQDIIKDYTNQGLRRLTARFEAAELSNEISRSTIEQNLTSFLTVELSVLGLAPLRTGGVLIKEVVAPEKFKRGLLNAGRLEAMLQTLTGYHALGNLIQQAIQAGLITGLEDLENSNLAFLPEIDSLRSQRMMEAAHHIPMQNGHNGSNGHNGYSRH